MHKLISTSISQSRGYCLLMFLLFSTGSVFAQNVLIFDEHFKQALLDDASINTNGDDEIQLSEAALVESLIVSGYGIVNLQGIAAFTSLKHLDCSDNELVTVNLSANTELTTFSCQNNQIEYMVLPPSITYLNCSDNQLTYLDVTHLWFLDELDCSNNHLTSLDVSRNFSLLALKCNNNDLNYINIKSGANTEIFIFQATGNPDLACVQVDNQVLATLYWSPYVDPGVTFSNQCSQDDVDVVIFYDLAFKQKLLTDYILNADGDNEIQKTEAASFDGVIDISHSGIHNVRGISNFTSITGFLADGNFLTTVDLSHSPGLQYLSVADNNLEHLNIATGRSGEIIVFRIQGNPKLTCVQVDQDEWPMFPGIEFSQDCGPVEVDVPDKLFLDRLVSQNSGLDINKDNLVQISEAASFTGVIDVTGHFDFEYDLNTDPTGFEAFTNATGLIAYYMGIDSLDLSRHTALALLDLNGNKLTYLNVQNGNNQNFTRFDVRGNGNLSCIQVDNVAYSEANWTSKGSGAFYSTDCKAVEDPVVLIPDVNFKTVLLANAAINTNGDGEIQVTEAEAFNGQIKANGKKIADLTGIEAFVNLKDLRVHVNKLTSVDLSANVNLVQLHVQNNKLTTLDLATNTKLDMLRVQNNLLSELDVSASVKLRYLEVTNNQLSFLNVKNGNNRRMYKFSAKNNPYLTCIEVDDASFATSNWSDNVDAGASFSEDCSGGGARVAAEGAALGTPLNISVYPNPSSDYVKVTGEQWPDELRLFSVTGEEMGVRFVNGEADIRHLKNGIYILKMYREDAFSSIKLVKR